MVNGIDALNTQTVNNLFKGMLRGLAGTGASLMQA